MSTFIVHQDHGPALGGAWYGHGWTRDELVSDLLGGQIEHPARILEIDPDHAWGGGRSSCGVGWTRDISTEVAREIIHLSRLTDRRIPQSVVGFVDRHYAREAV